MASDPKSQHDQLLPVARPITLTSQDKAVLSKVARVHTTIQAAQVWADRLRLTSLYASFFTTIDSLLFRLVSDRVDRGLANKLSLSSLTGALIFHAAAAVLAYVGSLVLIRHRLSDAQEIPPENPSPRAVAITADAESADPHISDSEPITATRSQTASTLGPGYVTFVQNVEHGATSSAHPSPIPTTRVYSTDSTTSTGVGFSLLSDFTDTLATLLHHPAGRYIDMRREPLFNLRAMMPCVGAPADGVDSTHDAGPQKNAIALAILLSKCHDVCSFFAFVGFVLVVTGTVACLWELLEPSVAIFGSVCVAVCLVLGFGALH